MANGNGFGVKLGFEFDSFDKVNKEYLQYIQKLSQSGQVKIGMDTKNLDSLKETFNQLSKTNIKVFDSGAYSQIQTLKNSMGELLKITENFNNQGTRTSTSYAISGSNKELENQKALYKELNNLQQTEFKLKQQMITADRNVYTELNRQLEVTRQMQSSVGRVINKSGLTDEEQTNSLLRQRIELTNSLKLTQAKNIDNQEAQELKNTLALKKEQEQVQQLIKNKTELLNIDKQRLTRQFGEKVDTSNIDASISKLKTMGNIDLSTLKNEFKNIDTNIKQITEDARSSESVFSKFGNTLRTFGIYINLADVVRQLGQAFRDATGYIENMDKAMTNIQMITGKSKEAVQDTVSQFKQLGEQMHTTNADMISGSEEVLRAGYSSDDAKSVLSASVMGSKISGQDMKTTTEQLIAMKNAFNMTGNEVEHVVDLLSKADNTSATSFSELASAIQRTAFSAQQAGTPLETLVSYVTTVSEKTRKSAETIGESFKTIYSRYSNIKIGNLDEDGKSINDTETVMKRIGIQIRDGKNQFREFDVVLKEFLNKYKSGQLTQVDFLAGAQALAGTRQRETLLALAENTDALAQHQRDLASATGSAKKMFDEVYSNSLDARINDLKRSFEGFYERILSSDALKTGISLLTKFIDTFGNIPSIVALATTALLIFKGQAIAGFIASLTQAIAKTGLLKLAIAELDIAFSANPIGVATIAIAGLIGAFVALQPHIETISEKIEGLKKSTESLSSAQSSQSLVEQYKTLQSTINDTSTPTDKLTEANKNLLEIQKQLADQFPELVSGYDNEGNAIVSNIDKVQKKINEDKDGAIKKAQQSYNDVFSALTEKKEFTAPADVENGINPITTELPSEVETYNQLLDKQAKWTEAESKRFDGIKKNLTDMNNAVLLVQKNGGDISDMKMFDFDKREMVDAKEHIKNINEETKKANENINSMGGSEKITTISKALAELKNSSDLSSGSMSKLKTMLPNLDLSNMSAEEKTKALAQAQKELQNSLDATGQKAESTADKIKGMSDAFSKTSSIVTTLEKALKEYQEHGMIDESTMKNIFDSGDTDLIALLGDSNTFMEKGNALLKEKKTLQAQQRDEIIKTAQAERQTVQAESQKAQAVTNMVNDLAKMSNKTTEDMAKQYGIDVNNKATSEAQKLAITDSVLNDMAQQSGKTVDELGRQYGIDVSNKNQAETEKDNVVSQLLTALAEKTGKTTDELARQYGIDVNNKNQAENDKGSATEQLLNALSTETGSTVDELGRQYGVDVSNFASATQKKKEALDQLYEYAVKVGEATGGIAGTGIIDGVASKISVVYGALLSGHNTVDIGNINSNYNPVGVGNTSGAGSSGGSTGGSTGSTAQKTISYITDEYEALKDLKDAVDKVNDAIDLNQTLAEKEEGQKKIDLMKQQIDLYNQLRNAQNNLKNGEIGQKNDLKQHLLGNGFSFNGDDLVGSQERLQALQNYFNSQMNANNDSALKSQYDQIKKWVDSYEKLVRDEIPNVTKDIIDINNKILSSQKEISEELQKQRDDFIKAEESKTESVKKELEKRRKALEDEKNKEDKADELGEKQKSLNDLQQKYSEVLKTGDAEQIKQARKNIEDSQRELNKYLKDNNYQEEVDRISNESTYVEDESKSKIDNINKQLSDDNILKLVQQGVTNIDNMLSNVKASTEDLTTPIYNIGDIINNNWLTATEKMKNNLADASSILRSSLVGGNVGINQNMTVTAKDTKPVDINIKQEINVQGDVTKDSLPKIQDALDDFKDEFYKFKHDISENTTY